MALFGVVVALTALTLVAGGLAASAALDRRRTADALESLQADALVRSAVATAGVLLADQVRTGEPDSARAAWARPLGRQAAGPGWVEVTVEDEARRLDLNAPGADVALRRLLQALALDPGVADAVLDWTDRDDAERPHGGERDWYRRHDPPLVPPNAPLASIGELALVRGSDSRVVERLRPFVTVAGEPRVNPNTASPEVLAAWLGDRQRANDILARRTAQLVPCDDLPPCTTHAQHYRVQVTASVGRVRRRVEAIVWAAGSEPRVTGWRQLDEAPSATAAQWTRLGLKSRE